MSDKITVLTIDSSPLWCLGVATVINGQPDMLLVAQALTGREAIDYFRRHQADIILTDVRLPDISGIEFMIAIRAEFPNVVHAGKRQIPASIAAQLAEHFGDELLSDREVEVLRHLSYGNRNRDIAEKLFIAEETVKAHMKHIMHKLGANDRTQALTIALRRGLIYL